MSKRRADQNLNDTSSKRPRRPAHAIACPFSKHPQKKRGHANCRKWSGRAISDLKLHFQRCHYLVYCFICYQVFTSENKVAELEQHLSTALCQPQPEHPETRDKLSQDQMQSMFGGGWKSVPHRAGLDDVERKWYFIWDQLVGYGVFPSETRPDSIEHLETAECELRREHGCEDVEKYTKSEEHQQHLQECAEETGVPMHVLTRISRHLFTGFLTYLSQGGSSDGGMTPPRPPPDTGPWMSSYPILGATADRSHPATKQPVAPDIPTETGVAHTGPSPSQAFDPGPCPGPHQSSDLDRPVPLATELTADAFHMISPDSTHTLSLYMCDSALVLPLIDDFTFDTGQHTSTGPMHGTDDLDYFSNRVP
ncbi:hypothetical protein QBC43DRAFT_361893 [Cladorrhinum sp. PSN259]|nr:hypothetical protein QBC43DRAFT_361893 [Cladorrhinum sp. PSN259]